MLRQRTPANAAVESADESGEAQAPEAEVTIDSPSGFLLYKGTLTVSVGRIEVEQYSSRDNCNVSTPSHAPNARNYGLLRVAECRTCVLMAQGPVETWWIQTADFEEVGNKYVDEKQTDKEKEESKDD